MKIKNTIIVILFIAVIILLLLQKCGRGGGITETIKYDTVYLPVKKDTAYVPQPYAVYVKGKNIPVEKWDTLYLPEVIEDSSCIGYYNQLKDYFTRMYLYSDTVRNKYGYMVINDSITQNKIAGRRVKTDLTIPEVTKTITKILPPKNQVYLGAELFGNRNDFAAGMGLNISLKTKKDRILETGYLQQFNGDGYFKIGYKHKLSFKK